MPDRGQLPEGRGKAGPFHRGRDIRLIPRNALPTRARAAKAMMDFLRKATYVLSPTPLTSYDFGHEFE